MSALVAAIGGRAEAAPATNWTGFYIGGFAGSAWGHSDFTSNTSCPSGPLAYFCTSDFAPSLPNGTAVGAAGTGSASSSRFAGGMQAGYNVQLLGMWLVGLETDFGAFNIRVSRNTTSAYPVNGPVNPGATAGTPFTVGTSAETNWLYTLRARIGATFANDVLIYATGGLALSRVKVDNSFSDQDTVLLPWVVAGSGSASELKTGYVVGGGAEWKFAAHWTAKVEYLYVNLGSVTANGVITSNILPPSGTGYSHALNTKADISASTLRFGVNYQF